MIELLILSVWLAVILALLTRRGAQRLAGGWVGLLFMGYGALIGMLLEALPFCAVRAPFSLRTFVGILAGVFGMRLLGRGVTAWAAGYRDEDRGAKRSEARLLHPLIAIGIFVSGVLVLHEAATARHLALEIDNTPRDAETGIVKGAEPIDLPREGAAGAVLLLHGFIASPADYGDLPAALHEAGYAVRVPLLPGHGTTPRELAKTGPEQWYGAARDAFDALAAEHEHVHVVGFSMGGMLATELAHERPVTRLVLVNPFVGETATPWFSPLPTDTLVELAAPLVEYVMRPESFIRVNDRSTLHRMRVYRTVPVGAVKALRDRALLLRGKDAYGSLPCPTLLVLSRDDHVTPSGASEPLVGVRAERDGPAPAFEEQAYGRSDHLLLLDFDRDAATARIVDWLRR